MAVCSVCFVRPVKNFTVNTPTHCLLTVNTIICQMSCGLPTHDCMGLTASSSALPINASASRRFVAAFSASPHLFYASWGGQHGLASRLMSAARQHAQFSAVVDIGCNAGDWSRQWLNSGRRVGASATGQAAKAPSLLLCVEALPSIAASTRRRFDAEGLSKRTRVAVVNAALSNVSSGRQPLFGLPSTSKYARLQTGAGLSSSPTERAHMQIGTVETTTLDELLRSWRLMERGGVFVKVDVEGFDAHVLAGGACALRHAAIDALQIEWNRRKLPAAAPPCVTLKRIALFLEGLGYQAYLVGRPYVPLNFGQWHEAYEGRNPRFKCPPFCTGDVVALRRGWSAVEAVEAALTSTGRIAQHQAVRAPKIDAIKMSRRPKSAQDRVESHHGAVVRSTAATDRPRVLSPFVRRPSPRPRTGLHDFSHSSW